MGYLYIKLNYDKNTFTDLELSNLTFFFTKKVRFKKYGKGKILKIPSRFELMHVTHWSVVNPLTHCARLFEDKFGKETVYWTVLYSIIVYFDKLGSQHGGVL